MKFILRKFLTATSLLCIILLGSCYYEPDGKNFVTIDPPSGSGIIDLNNYGDTVYMDQSKLLIFTFNGNSSLDQYEVYIDGKLYYTYLEPTEKNNISLDANKIGTGTHSMEVKVFAKSNSGSLADLVGAEQIIFSKSFTLLVDIDIPDRREVTIDTTQGTMKIKWNAYNRWKFRSYNIIKTCTNGGECNVYTITDSTETQWTDPDFIGGLIQYRVDLKTTTDTRKGVLFYHYSNVSTSITVLPGKKLQLQWSKPTFYQNLKSITIKHQGTIVKTITDINDTSIIVNNNLMFGTRYKNAFEIISEGKKVGVSTKQSVPFAHGRLIDTRESLGVGDGTYNKKLQRYYLKTYRNQDPFLTVYDENFNFLSEKGYSIRFLTISESGEKMYAYFYEPQENRKNFIHQMDPLTLDTLKTFSVTKALGVNNILWSKIEVSDNNLLAYHYRNGHALSEMPIGKILRWRTVSGAGVSISHDGKYYFDYNKIYEVDGSTLTEVGTVNPVASEPDMAFFRADKPYELIILKNNKIRVINVPDMSERTIDLGVTGYNVKTMYDSQSGWLLHSAAGSKPMMLHIDTGEKFFVPITEDVAGLVLVNSKLLSSAGYVADIQYVKSLVP